VTYGVSGTPSITPGLAPLPLQRPIPIWIGGSADVALRRAARLADGFFSNSGINLERAQHEVATIRAELERIDRDPATFGFGATPEPGGAKPRCLATGGDVVARSGRDASFHQHDERGLRNHE
jgi:hypothetical protein